MRFISLRDKWVFPTSPIKIQTAISTFSFQTSTDSVIHTTTPHASKFRKRTSLQFRQWKSTEMVLIYSHSQTIKCDKGLQPSEDYSRDFLYNRSVKIAHVRKEPRVTYIN